MARPRTTIARRRSHERAVGVIIAFGAIAASCGGSSSDDAANSMAATVAPHTEPVSSEPLFVRTGDDIDPPSSTERDDSQTDVPVVAAPDSTTTTTTVAIPLVPDTGVPGIDSDNDFCRAWSEFAGSFRAVGLVSGIRDEDAGLRLEVIASTVVVAAIAEMGDSLPPELEAERDTLLTDYAGPFGRRALKAADTLADAGISPDAAALLAEAWLEALAAAGIDDPELDVAVPAAVDADLVDSAVLAFTATTPAIGDDPSLSTFTEIPLTDTYTLTNCPDAGTLAGNDDL